MVIKTAQEKVVCLTRFSSESMRRKINHPQKITKQWVHEFLSAIYDTKGGHVANKYRKHLLAAWNWGLKTMDDFPSGPSPLLNIPPFQVESKDRYVPPDEDINAVLAQAKGQDLVMLTTYIYTGARKQELFRLRWEDVDLEKMRLRLTDRKGGSGKPRVRWQRINDVLAEALVWWREARPIDVPNVFMQLSNHRQDVKIGDPFKQRRALMSRLCQRAGVRHFTLHALRHKGAAIVFKSTGLSEAQLFLGHEKATTTDRYLKSVGLYNDGGEAVNAIEKNPVGQTMTELVKKAIAPKAATSEAI